MITTTSAPMITMTHHEQQQPNKEFPNFSISQEELTKLVQDNNRTSLQQLGGVQGIAAALETHLDRGLCGLDKAEFHRRHLVFGSNFKFDENFTYSPTRKGYFWGLIIIKEAMKDTTFVLLLFCAILSLAFGIKTNGLKEETLDALTLFIVILIAFHVSRIIKFLIESMIKNHDQKYSRKTKAVSVLRDGREQKVSVSELVVGDVVFLEKGDRVPADGLFVRGDRLKLDDHDHDHVDDDDDDDYQDQDHVHNCFDYHKFPSILNGAKVVSGKCYMLVTSVGNNTEASKIMMKLSKSDQNKESSSSQKLITSIENLNSRLEKIWLTITLLLLVVQVLRCFIWSKSTSTDPKGMQETAQDIMTKIIMMIKKLGGTTSPNRFVEMLCVLIFALRDGLPLGLLISFHAFKKLMSYQTIVIRNLQVCGSIGLVTAVCVDKTNDMSLEPTKMIDLYIGMDKVCETLAGVDVDVLDALREGIVANVSLSDFEDDHRLLFWTKHVLGVGVEEMKRNCNIEALDHLKENLIGSLLTSNGSEENKNFATIHWRGAPEVILPMCTHYFDVHGTLKTINEHKRDHELKKIVEKITADDDSIKCIAFAKRQVEEDKEEEVPFEAKANRLTLLGFVCLKNPYTPELRQAIEKVYEKSTVKIKMILKEDSNTARLIATNCGILKPEEDTKEAVVEATVFRNSSEETQELMISNIKVLTNATPLDKLLMIQCLKRKGEVVAVVAIGMHTLDSASLKEADVGILMGDKSSEMAKENADIVVLDKDNSLSTVVGVFKSGRSLWNNIQKIIQLLLTLQIAAFAINQIGAVFFNEIPLEPLRLLWFSFVMDVLGALALARPIVLQEQVHVHDASTWTTKTMWRNISIQVVFQVTIFLAIQLKGKELLLHANQTAINTIVFNTFVLCQVFALIDAREIEKPDVFEGMMMPLQYQNKYWFLATVGTIIVLQIATIEVITIVSHEQRIMNLKNWSLCIGIAAMSLPIGLIVKCIPWPCSNVDL